MYNVVCLAESKDDGSLEEVKEVIEEFGQIKEEKEVGEMSLAYEIDEKTQGFYFWLDFSLEKGENKIKELKEELSETDLLRYLISKKPEEALTSEKEKAEKKKEQEKEKEQEKTEDEKEVKETKEQEKTEKTEEKEKEAEESEEKRMEDLDEKLEDIL